MYIKAAFEVMHDRFAEELAITSTHPFRHPDDVITPILHYAVVTQENVTIDYEVVFEGAGHFVKWTDNLGSNKRKWRQLMQKPRLLFNLNDDMTQRGWPRAVKQ